MYHWSRLSPDADWLRDACGYFAGSLVLSSFSVTSMRRLRWLGIASNVSFISYAIMAGMLPILILHSLLLPINLFRLYQIERDRGRSRPLSSQFGAGALYAAMPTSSAVEQE